MANLRAGGSKKPKKQQPTGNSFIDIVYDDQDIVDALEGVKKRQRDLRPVYKAWGEYMLLATDDRYVKETSPEGVPWKKNSPRTLAIKRSLGRINKILQSTGLMRSTYNYSIEGDGLKFGTNDPKAFKHQFGIGVPIRKHLGVSSEDIEEMKNQLIQYLATGRVD